MTDQIKYPNIEAKLLEENGNTLNMIAITEKALHMGGVSTEEINEFRKEALSGDYDKALSTILDWVEVV